MQAATSNGEATNSTPSSVGSGSRTRPNVSPNGNFKGSLAKFATGVRINATGGWFDAGDYLHFTNTTAYTSGDLMFGYNDTFASIGDSNNFAIIDNVIVTPHG